MIVVVLMVSEVDHSHLILEMVENGLIALMFISVNANLR